MKIKKESINLTKEFLEENHELLIELGKTDDNPANYCYCGKHIGKKGFCSEECHDKYYDEMIKKK